MGRFTDFAANTVAQLNSIQPTRELESDAHMSVLLFNRSVELLLKALDGVNLNGEIDPEGPSWKASDEDVNLVMKDLVSLRKEAESGIKDSLAKAYNLVYAYAMFEVGMHKLQTDRRTHTGRASLTDEAFNDFVAGAKMYREGMAGIILRFAHGMIAMAPGNMTQNGYDQRIAEAATYSERKFRPVSEMSPPEAMKELVPSKTPTDEGCDNPDCPVHGKDGILTALRAGDPDTATERLFEVLMGRTIR